jgi:hypothetical protein
MKAPLLLICLLAFCSAYAQFDPNYKTNKEVEYEDAIPVNVGLGIGISYGGIGGRLTYFPQRSIGLFAAAGYNLHKAGFNGGLVARILPDKKVCPIAMAMYGYNAVIVVEGASEYNKTYYGPSFGGGIELRMGQNGNYMNFELLLPIRSQDYRDDMDALQNNPSIEITEASPVSLSIGYHFVIR